MSSAVLLSGSLHLLALAFHREIIPRAGYPGKDQAWDSRSQAYSTPSFNLSRRVDSETDELMHDVFGVSTVCRFYDDENRYGSRTSSGTFDARCV